MTLAECRRYALKLIDEYSNRGSVLPDADIQNKMLQYMDGGQKMLCNYDRIRKLIPLLPVLDRDAVGLKPVQSAGGKLLYEMPREFKEFIQLWHDLKPAGKGEWIAGRLVMEEKMLENGNWQMEYFAYPRMLRDDDPPRTELELSPDGCVALAYWVAYNLLTVDLNYDGTRIWAVFQTLVQGLKDRYNPMRARVKVTGVF